MKLLAADAAVMLVDRPETEDSFTQKLGRLGFTTIGESISVASK
jgi:hypothetical protein